MANTEFDRARKQHKKWAAIFAPKQVKKTDEQVNKCVKILNSAGKITKKLFGKS